MASSDDLSSGEVAHTKELTPDLKEKLAADSIDEDISEGQIEADLNATGQDVRDAKEEAEDLTLEHAREIMANAVNNHQNDPNFPLLVLQKARKFLGDPDVLQHSENHLGLIAEMKTEAALIHGNSAYAEVRAVVKKTDDVNMPSSTIRAWVIGMIFVVALAFINQLFSIRLPSILVVANVAQVLCYPVAKVFELLPDRGFTLFGTRHSLNPSKFTPKEHMLITIMANVAYSTPYTDNIIWVQYLPLYFNQSFAGRFSYQILVALSTNFIGYSLAGLCRRFLVYPAHCIWPSSLVTIALNDSFHQEENISVAGPFKKMFHISRFKYFCLAFGAMFVWFWFPDYIFTALSAFSWISWIAPNNLHLNAVTGFNNGLGLNPFPTFDWNVLQFNALDPLIVPFFSMANQCAGMFLSMPLILVLWYTNAYHFGYLPINSNHVFDHFGKLYNVSKVINSKALFDEEKYESYSQAYLAAGNTVLYLGFFAVYGATMTYFALYHRSDLSKGFRSLANSFRAKKVETEQEAEKRLADTDIHNRLMASYPEAPEWWYMACLVLAVAAGLGGLMGWPTETSPGVIFYGIAMCLVFVLPVGIIKAMTGNEVTMNVLAEFIGGAFSAGNALSMNFFKAYGYVTCAHAVAFSNDLKLAHYLKIPPKHTFWAQMMATLVSTFVCTAVLNYQMNDIPGVCTIEQKDHYSCPGINTFFTASVLWGTIGPKKVFGPGGQYTLLLLGFPFGMLLTLAVWGLQKRFPNSKFVRGTHAVSMVYGMIQWAPYNLSYLMPSLPISYFSMVFLKSRYVSFWSKYNYITSAAFSSAMAIAGVIIFFAVQMKGVELDWWGNSVNGLGCDGKACPRLQLAKGEYFGPRMGDFH